MTWDKLGGRLKKLPLVLAGPILRKVTPTSVTVWLALKESATVTLDVHIGHPTVGAKVASGERPTVRIGKNLHLVAVTARILNKNLTSGEVYFYHLYFKQASSPQPQDLKQATGRNDWGYSPDKVPSFALPPRDLADVRLIQGSCRKPNATGSDALNLLDELIEASFQSANARPHQLILSGDQIYADEVADVLLMMLTDAAAELLGPETLPHPLMPNQVIDPNIYEPISRMNLIPRIGFTTDDKRSHLMSLGEYLCMYLFVWSEALWPPNIPDWDDLVQAIKDQKDDDFLLHAAKLRDAINDDRTNVITMRSTLPTVRRALANIPTYMLCDDHEVTDDWNMTREFCDDVYGNPTGTRIIQNALVAYSLCQHWGNCPEQFENSGAAGFTLLKLLNNAASYNATAANPQLMKIVGVHTADQLKKQTPYRMFHDVGNRQQLPEGWIDSESLLFHYTIEAPAYQIIVTDTRTWRSWPRGGGNQTPSDLIADSQIPFQIGSTPPLRKDGVDRLLIVIVSTNMPPGPAIRQGARDLPELGRSYRYEDFFDGWDIDRIDFALVLKELSLKFKSDQKGLREGQVVLLSGDVHSSQASRMFYEAKMQVRDDPNKPNPTNLVLAQLVGSALRNEGTKTLGQHDDGYEYVPPKMAARILKQSIVRKEGFIGWNPKVVKDFETVGTRFWHDLAFEHKDIEFGFLEQFPTKTLRDQELPKVWNTHINSITLPPHYRIRLDYLKAAQGGRYKVEPVVIPPKDPLNDWSVRSRSYERYANARYSGREIVGKNNIGEIEFRESDLLTEPKLSVLFTVRWEETDIQFVRFDVSLDIHDKNYDTIYHKSERRP